MELASQEEVILASQEVLSRHARTFRLASVFLAPDAREDAALLYAVCRLVDDLADEASDVGEARRELQALRRELDGEAPARPLIHTFLEMARRRGLSLDSMRELITGVESDLEEVIISDDEELLRYCYRVAGTVGLMMCAVLGVEDERGLAHAIDLGVAMQLTNICRDVLEDARRGRVYVPSTRLAAEGLSPDEVLDETADRGALARVVEGLLELAERYYGSADEGMKYIPARSRMAIVVASRVYRAIGLRLRSRGSDAMAGRTVVPVGWKVLWVLWSIWVWAWLSVVSGAATHEVELHEPLKGLPGASS